MPIENAIASRSRVTARFLLLLTLGLLGLISTACRSPETPASGRFAAVEIEGNTPGQIAAVAQEVFRTNGFSATSIGLRELVFEKKGSTMNQIAYGDWVGGDPIWVRVKLAIVTAGETRFRLECRAFMVRDKGGSVEEELKISHVHRRPYQKMLDEVAARFHPRGVNAPSG